MIIFNNNKTEAQNIDPELLNGVFYGIICGVYIKEQSETNTTYSCSVYIPEIYGPYECFYNYPKVDIPEKQDNDDKGSVPQVGNLVKVSFDDGNSNSCRLLLAVPTDTEIQIRNANYINNGVLPTTILDIEDPKVLQTVLDWLDDAYFITVGKHRNKITISDFFNQYYLTSKSGFNNYFLAPLSLPFATYITQQEGSIIESAPPYFLSNIYLYADVILDLVNTKRKELIKIYDDIIYWSKSYPDYFLITDDEMQNIENKDDVKVVCIACLMSGIVPNYAKILFPNLDKNISDLISYKLDNHNNGLKIMQWWNFYTNSPNPTYHYPAKFVLDNQSDYETEWAKACVSWETGLNTIVANPENVLLKRAIVMCFTIFPWIAYLLLGYELSSSSVFSPEVLQKAFKFYGKEYRSYTAIFKSDKEYKETITKLSNLLHKSDLTIKEFVTSFQKIIKILYTANTWKNCDMDDKFKRLLDISKDWNEIETQNYNAITTDGTSFQVPSNQRDFKSYMDLTAMGKDTVRRKFIENKGHIDENGIWKIGQYYCVAMGQYYTGKGSNFDLGRTFQITLNTRVVLNVVITEAKALNDTTDNYKVDKNNGSIIEFIVNTSRLNNTARRMGSLSSLPAFKGTITSIVKTGKIS